MLVTYQKIQKKGIFPKFIDYSVCLFGKLF